MSTPSKQIPVLLLDLTRDQVKRLTKFYLTERQDAGAVMFAQPKVLTDSDVNKLKVIILKEECFTIVQSALTVSITMSQE